MTKARPPDHLPALTGGNATRRTPPPMPPGGAWVHGSRILQGYALMDHLAGQGCVCLPIGYRVPPNHRWPQHISDVTAAIAWARAAVDRFGGDRGLSAIAGCSAGGHRRQVLLGRPLLGRTRPLRRHRTTATIPAKAVI